MSPTCRVVSCEGFRAIMRSTWPILSRCLVMYWCSHLKALPAVRGGKSVRRAEFFSWTSERGIRTLQSVMRFVFFVMCTTMAWKYVGK